MTVKKLLKSMENRNKSIVTIWSLSIHDKELLKTKKITDYILYDGYATFYRRNLYNSSGIKKSLLRKKVISFEAIGYRNYNIYVK